MTDSLLRLSIYILVFFSISIFVWVLARFFVDGFGEFEKKYLHKASKTLNEMYVFYDVRKIFILNLVLLFLFLVLGTAASGNLLFGLFMGGIGFFIPKLIINQARKKRLKKFEGQLIDGLVVLSNALRSGMNLVQAIEIVEYEMQPPISQEFGLVIRENRLGVNIEEALENLARRIPLEDLKLLVTSINIVHGMGGNLTEIFDSMAEVLRERNELKGKTDALTSQGKLQGVIVGLMPTVVGVIMYLMDPPAMIRMFTNLWGIISIGVMLGLQISGFFILKKITTIRI